MKKYFKIGFCIVIIFGGLLVAFYPNFSFADVSKIEKIIFTTDVQTVEINTFSEKITIQTQNSSSTSEALTETDDLSVTSSSPTGRFYSNNTTASSTDTFVMSSSTANKNFYYKDSSGGLFTITATLKTRITENLWTTTQNITINPPPSIPVITISNPDTSSAESKIITATTTEGTFWQSIRTDSVCDNSLGAENFFSYSTTTFSSESDNGKTVCYKAIGIASTTYSISNTISGIDTTTPIISLIGENSINIRRGSAYTEQGATSTDNVDGDLTANINISGTVNTSSNGSYVITYSVADNAGNSATTTRTVNVAGGRHARATVVTPPPSDIETGTTTLVLVELGSSDQKATTTIETPTATTTPRGRVLGVSISKEDEITARNLLDMLIKKNLIEPDKIPLAKEILGL